MPYRRQQYGPGGYGFGPPIGATKDPETGEITTTGSHQTWLRKHPWFPHKPAQGMMPMPGYQPRTPGFMPNPEMGGRETSLMSFWRDQFMGGDEMRGGPDFWRRRRMMDTLYPWGQRNDMIEGGAGW